MDSYKYYMALFFSFLRQSATGIDALNEYVGRGISWLTLAMVLLTFAIVICRYLFDASWVPVQEAVIYMHSIVFMLGAAYTLKHDGHVRVDIVYQKCNPKIKAWIDLVGTLLLLLPVAGFIFWSSWEYVLDAWEITEGSRNSGGLPFIYLLKSCLLLMSGLLVLQAVALFMQKIVYLFAQAEAAHG